MILTKYTVAIEVTKPSAYAFNRIVDLSKWWVEDFVGEKLKPGSEFILKTGEGHYSKNKVMVLVPAKKFAWVTTESKRNTDNFDWTGTKMIFELMPKGNCTLIQFTYDGVVLEKEQEKLKEICDYCIKDLLYNYLESFDATIEIEKSPREVFKIITDDVSKWWGGKDLSGRTTKLNDEFIVHHQGAHYSKQKLIEIIPEKKVVWQVTEGTLYWLKKDKQEWTNTKMIFEISVKNGKTVLHFTHEGLVPEKECYEACQQGWTMVITDWLYHYITKGKVNQRFL
ncbi:MAG TPA: SRPBCC domain-containing protein [Puia sp.]|nr:SRPBCC domain-containing protein [Puia sp.]